SARNCCIRKRKAASDDAAFQGLASWTTRARRSPLRGWPDPDARSTLRGVRGNHALRFRADAWHCASLPELRGCGDEVPAQLRRPAGQEKLLITEQGPTEPIGPPAPRG